MQAYGHILYMDVQKTGSTFITGVLDEVLDLPRQDFPKHSRLERDKEPGEFVVISTREPLDAWLSLYNFGCEGKGRMYKGLSAAGLAERYYTGTPGGFAEWVRLLNSPGNEKLAKENFPRSAHLGMGFQNFREFVMSVSRPLEVLARCSNRADVERALASEHIIDVRLRHSHLQQDLLDLLRGPLAASLIPGIDVEAVLGRREKVNASRQAVTRADLNDQTVAFVAESEWLTPTFERLG